MFSKLGLAAAILAVGSFATADIASAKRLDKGKRHARNAVEHHGPVANHRAPKLRKKKKKNIKKIVRALGAVAVAAAASQRNHYRYRDHYVAPRDSRRNRWSGRRDHFRHRGVGKLCVAVAKRRHGYGRRIPVTRAKAYGRRACRKAMNRCENRLYDRQAHGRNPHASCVIVRRGYARR